MQIVGYSFINKNGKERFFHITLEKEEFWNGITVDINDSSIRMESYNEAKGRIDDLAKTHEWDITDVPVYDPVGYYYFFNSSGWRVLL